MSAEKNDVFVPQAVLTIYEAKEAINGSIESKMYVEIHDVDNKGNILSGKPLTEEFANSFAKSLHKANSLIVSGRITPNVLYIGWQNEKPIIVWHTPKCKRKAFYSEALNIPNAEIEVPALIWRYNSYSGSLHMVAIKEGDAIKDDMQLYYAPFHNAYFDHHICLGSGSGYVRKREEVAFQTLMQDCEFVFWNTEFSAIHNDKAIKGNLNSLHKDLTAGQPFPMEKLIPHDLKIPALCK